MKTKNYEKQTGIIIIIVFLLLVEMICYMECKNTKVVNYHQIPMVIINDHEGYVIVKKEDRKNFYKSKYLYINNQKIEYEIQEDQIIEGRKEYQIKIKLSKKIKEKDVAMLTIENKKTNIIDMIMNAWGGDKNS